MNKNVYHDIEKIFKSNCIYYLGGIHETLDIFNVDYTKVNTLNELLEIFNKDKEKHKEFYDKYFDKEGVVGFLQYYDKTYHIWENSNGDLSLFFSILLGFMLEIFYGQDRERKYKVKRKSGEIEEIEKRQSIIIKGKKENIDEFYKGFNNPAITQYKKIARFLYRSEEFHIEDYVRNSLPFKLYTYKPDYILVGLALNRYAHKISEINTSKIIERKKVIVDAKLKLEMKNMHKIADEIIEKVKKDINENPYMSNDFLNYFIEIRNLNLNISNMVGCSIMSIDDFFMSGGQLVNR